MAKDAKGHGSATKGYLEAKEDLAREIARGKTNTGTGQAMKISGARKAMRTAAEMERVKAVEAGKKLLGRTIDVTPKKPRNT